MDISTYIDTHFWWVLSHFIIILGIIGVLIWNTVCRVRKLKEEIRKLKDTKPVSKSLGMKTKISRDITRLQRRTLNNDLENK